MPALLSIILRGVVNELFVERDVEVDAHVINRRVNRNVSGVEIHRVRQDNVLLPLSPILHFFMHEPQHCLSLVSEMDYKGEILIL